MAGKRGLVMGVANDRSIAWGIARVLHGQGAELAFSYQGGAFGRRAGPLAESIRRDHGELPVARLVYLAATLLGPTHPDHPL